jgi:hypothetical protein
VLAVCKRQNLDAGKPEAASGCYCFQHRHVCEAGCAGFQLADVQPALGPQPPRGHSSGGELKKPSAIHDLAPLKR